VDDFFELKTVLQFGIHFRPKEPDAIAALSSGFVNGRIRAFRQPLGRVAIDRRERHARPTVVNNSYCFGRIGSARGRTEPLRKFLGLFAAADVGLSHTKSPPTIGPVKFRKLCEPQIKN